MDYSFEALSKSHRWAVIEIFNHYIAHSHAAFPEELVDYEFFDHFLEMSQGYPAVVVKDNTGEVIGFAFLHPHHLTPTFNRTAEITYFLLPEHTGRGLGTAILQRFIEAGRKLAIDNFLACISSNNKGSLRFHRKNGFRQCGRFRQVGRKWGRDFDTIWMQLHL